MLALPQTVMETVFQNKKVISWDSEPHYTAFGEKTFYFPKILRPPWVRSFLGCVFGLTLHILYQVSWLTFQEGADCVQDFPGYQFPPPELLKV